MELHPDNLRYILGLKLRTYRQEKGHGLKELAQATGLSVSYLSEIEKGRKYPKPDKLLELARALEVPFEELVSPRVGDRLRPFRDLLSTSFLQDFPLHLFGLQAEDVLGLLAGVPERTGALVRTILEMARTYDVGVEHVQFAALRSYQHMRSNYFDDIEAAAQELRREQGWQGRAEPAAEQLQEILEGHGYGIDSESLPSYPSLAGLRSVWVGGESPRLLLNPQLLPSQKAFQMARELGYLQLGLKERSVSSSPLTAGSFEQVIHDFQAAYFAGALLIDAEILTADVEALLARREWSDAALLDSLEGFGSTPETYFYRLSQIFPGRFELRDLYFLRFSSGSESQPVYLTKMLNMTKVPVPHGIGSGEHYCRRWPGVELLRPPPGLAGRVGIAVQRSRFLNDGAEFLVISLGRPMALAPGTFSSVSLGLLVTDELRRRVAFLEDPSLPVRDVNLTCERCPLADCAERAAPPKLAEEAAKQAQREADLALLRSSVD